MIVDDKQLREMLRKLCNEAGTQRAFAKQKRISPSVLSDVINGRRDFTKALLKALKAKRLPANYTVPEMKFEDIE